MSSDGGVCNSSSDGIAQTSVLVSLNTGDCQTEGCLVFEIEQLYALSANVSLC